MISEERFISVVLAGHQFTNLFPLRNAALSEVIGPFAGHSVRCHKENSSFLHHEDFLFFVSRSSRLWPIAKSSNSFFLENYEKKYKNFFLFFRPKVREMNSKVPFQV